MNIEMMKEIEKQELEVLGILALTEPTEQVVMAKQQLVTMIKGLHLVINGCERYPMTVEELEQEFNLRKKEIQT